jgi:hypothetical protein
VGGVTRKFHVNFRFSAPLLRRLVALLSSTLVASVEDKTPQTASRTSALKLFMVKDLLADFTRAIDLQLWLNYETTQSN